MKKTISLIILFAFLVPAFSYAATTPESCNTAVSSNTGQTSSNSGQTSSNSGPTKGALSNPVKGVPSIACLFYRIVDFVMSLSYVVIAIFLLLSGFKFVTAQGSDEKLTDAKRTFWYTIIGALILIGANTIIKVVQGIMSQLNS